MIQEIGDGLKEEGLRMDEVFDTRGAELEYYLTEVCNYLGAASAVTEGKADLEFMGTIVASYLIAKKEGKLEEDALPPAQLFDERLFPVLDETELKVEVIEEDEEGE